MNGRYADAAFIRELFDEPVTALCQVSALIRTLDDASNSGENFEAETMTAQVDKLIMSAIQALDGPEEAVMVGHLLKLRNSVQSRGHGRNPGRGAWRGQHVLRAGAPLGAGDRRVPAGDRQEGAVGSFVAPARQISGR